MAAPQVRYTQTRDGVNVAYLLAGSGPPLVRVLGWFTHIEQEWKWGHLPWERLAQEYTLVLYDGRGFGLSDRDVTEFSPANEYADLEAVVEAVGFDRVALFGPSAGASAAVKYAALHPERVAQLILLGPAMRPRGEQAYARYREQVEAIGAVARAGWESNSPAFRQLFSSLWMPTATRADHEGFNALQRAAAKGETVARWWERLQIDPDELEEYARDVQAPTLVVRRAGDQLSAPSASRRLAAAIPDSRFVTLDGDNHLFMANEPEFEQFLELLRALITPLGVADGIRGGFQTILFTDLEASTPLTQRLGDEGAQEILRGHNASVRGALNEHGGREVKHTGDGIMASFPSAVAAVTAALQIQHELAGGEVRVRVGLNAGEPIAEDEDLFGLSVIKAARVADRAEPGQVLVSRVVRELCEGKTFQFASLGEVQLKGFDEAVELFEVRSD